MPRTDQTRLESLLNARHPCVSIITYEEDHALAAIRHVAVEQEADLWVWSVTQGLRDGLIAGSLALPETEHPAAALFHIGRTGYARKSIFAMLDLAGHLKDERTLRTLREAIDRMYQTRCMLLLIDQRDDLPPVIARTATRLELSYPSEQELDLLIRSTLREINEEHRIHVDLSRRELQQIVRNLRGLTRRQAKQAIVEAVIHDRRLDVSDLELILRYKRRALSGYGLLEYVETPTSLDQIGGLKHLKAWLEKRRLALTDEAVHFGIDPPRGVLMLGVQGAGKSLSAKAVATAWQRPLLRMDAGALYDRYIGESERRLREALQQAQMMAPVILWIDEIEKAFASTASQSSDGGLSKRMFGTLLTWMQEHTSQVFLIATANDIEALPPELLRKGRFDEIFFVDLPDSEARRQIFAIHLRKRRREPDQFDLHALTAAADGFSGAEIEQAIIAGLHEAFAQQRELTTDDILWALETSPPLSVTMAEKVHTLRAWAESRCVPAD